MRQLQCTMRALLLLLPCSYVLSVPPEPTDLGLWQGPSTAGGQTPGVLLRDDTMFLWDTAVLEAVALPGKVQSWELPLAGVLRALMKFDAADDGVIRVMRSGAAGVGMATVQAPRVGAPSYSVGADIPGTVGKECSDFAQHPTLPSCFVLCCEKDLYVWNATAGTLMSLVQLLTACEKITADSKQTVYVAVGDSVVSWDMGSPRNPIKQQNLVTSFDKTHWLSFLPASQVLLQYGEGFADKRWVWYGGVPLAQLGVAGDVGYLQIPAATRRRAFLLDASYKQLDLFDINQTSGEVVEVSSIYWTKLDRDTEVETLTASGSYLVTAAVGVVRIYSMQAEPTAVPTVVPATLTPETKAPVTAGPTAVPTTLVPLTASPVTAVPSTPAPATKVPLTDPPETEPPVTVVPATSAPLTPVPLTDAPVTATPATPVPQTGVPSTPSPVTGVPATPAPQTNTPTHAPATPLSPTLAPGTRAPETPAPGPTAAPPLVATAAPLTPAPTATQPPDTEAPVTQVPHTPAPIAAPTPAPATDVPHTRAPATDVMPTPAPDAASSTGLVVGLSLAGLCVCAAAGAVLCRRRRPQGEDDTTKEMSMLGSPQAFPASPSLHEQCLEGIVTQGTMLLTAAASSPEALPTALEASAESWHVPRTSIQQTVVNTVLHTTTTATVCVVPQGPQVEGPVDEVYASWRWENHVGSGAYGEVHVGRVSTGRQVALKERVRATCGEAAEARAMLALMQRLQHPHIVEVLDMVYDPQQARLCVLMEYVAGTTLGAYARSLPHRMAEETAAHYVGQVLLALEFLHSHQVVHRDLKGDNVIVTGDGVAKLCDFGTVKDLAAGGGASAWGSSDGVTDSRLLNTQVGSPNFMAPEVLQSGVHVARAGTPADVYALGCMASEVLNCGVPPGPQAGNVWAAVMAAPQWPPANLVEGVSAEAGDFVAACTRQSPDDRATASQLLRHAFVTGAAGHTAPAVPPAAVWLTEEEMLAGERVRPALGMGAFGVVHRVRVPGGGGAVPVREVAVKEMFLGASHTAKVRQRAEQEFQLMRSLRHPHIVQYLGHRWPDASTLEIYMEYMPGGSVKAAVRAAQAQSQPQTRGLPIDTVKAYTRQVLLGLAYLHTGEAGRAPVAHRDLKADNLLLAGDGTVKIADFGCSKLFGVDAESERDGVTYGADGAKTCVGTPFWMAPEVLQQRHDASGAYGTRCDIWSLGCTVVEMLGTVPWRTATAEPAHQTVQRILESTDGPPLPADTPHDTAAFVRRCCVRDPAARPPATALLHDLMVLGADMLLPEPEPLL